MRRHNLLLSLLALLFAVFMTACDNGTTNNAKAPIVDGGDQGGGAITPTLSISYEIDKDNYMKVYFTGHLENANEEDYNFTWSFGDDVVSTESPLFIDHTYTIDKGYGVTLAATPKDPEKTPAIANATTTVTISQSGINIQTLRYSALSGMEYEFQAIATTTDGSPVLYTWDFGDGTVVEDTPQNAMTHRYTKYNTEFTVRVSVKKENAGNTGSVEFPEIKIKTHGVTAQLTIENDPSNARHKIMSVNFYDETGALIHGYSEAEGEVTGLDNVTYTWDFGDSKPGLTTNERLVEYTYGTGGSSNDYNVVVKASSDTFYGEISAENTTNVTLTYALTKLTATLGGQYGTVLTVVAEGNGGNAYKGQSVTYSVTYPNGNKENQTVTHDATTGVGTATFTFDLGKYYNGYNVKVEAVTADTGGDVLATRQATAQKPSFRYVLNGPNNGDNGYFSKSFNVTVAQNSFELKGAYFDWVTDGATKRTNVPNFSHTYAGPGSKTVTVRIDSDMLNDLDITVADLTKTFTINADVTINTFNCTNAGANTNFLRYDCRVEATGTSGTTLTYKWYKNGQAVSGCAGPYCEHTFDTYNKDYTVKVEVGVQGSNSAPKSQTFPITTPNAQVTITGPASGIHGQDAVYTATTKVTHNNSTKNITLSNVNYLFKLVENNNTSGNTGKVSGNKWTVAFIPGDSDYNSGNGAVTRTVYVEVTAGNLNGKITSNRVATRITKPAASMRNFNQPVISCRAKSDVNQVKQLCKMTVQVKSDAGVLTGQFSNYKAKFMYNNTQKVVNFNTGDITAGATGTTAEFEIDYNWPNNGDITTGASQQQSYVVTGEFYENGAQNDKLTARQANITITLSGDYTLYPLPDTATTSNSGGSGYRFGTWSCGYNESDGYFTSANCASNGSKTGQTLNLGNLANNNGTGTLKQTLKFEWRMKINSLGTSLPDTLIKKFEVAAGSKPTDNDLRFNISKVLRDTNGGVRYTGSAYGQSNIFYLKISSTDPNVLAKPIKIWYNGSNKTGQVNRLRKITPLMSTNGFNSCKIQYVQGGGGFPNRNVTFHVNEAKLLFAKFDPAQNIVQLIPNGDYKPFFRFYNKACGSNGVCNETNNYTKNTSIQNVSTSTEVGWYLKSNSGTVLDNKVTITAGLNSGTSTMKLIVRDMLQGSGGAEITDYYPVTECSGIFN